MGEQMLVEAVTAQELATAAAADEARCPSPAAAAPANEVVPMPPLTVSTKMVRVDEI